MSEAPTNAFRKIPAVDQLLRAAQLAELRGTIGTKRLTAVARLVLSEMRAELAANGTKANTETLLVDAIQRITLACELERWSGIRRVINATGVVLHTNLGRAPLSESAQTAISEVSRYCSLEYDTASGVRGSRGSRVELLLQQLTDAEDALVVNNCAAAALLILSGLASDGETIVSRGELVEIGGDFRVPDIMASSGTTMMEVGTTNRTHVEDYRRAVNSKTRLLMRVHPSNYKIIGFASRPQLSELVVLAHESKLPIYEDAGSGQISESTGELAEPSIASLIRAGADVVSFSGDKLLGAVQAGLIVGKREIINKLRKHPLYRALRSDKIRLAALEATLEIHVREVATEDLPTTRMLSLSAEAIRLRAEALLTKLRDLKTLNLDLVDGDSAVGGGAAPGVSLPTTLISVSHLSLSATEIEQGLRKYSPPVIARIADDKVLIDLRTVFEDEEADLCSALLSVR